MPNALTYEEVRERFDYDPESGVLKFRQHFHPRYIGSSPKCKHRDGYFVCVLKGHKYFVHRLIWLHVHGAWPDGEIDHINRDRTDNRIANLRAVTTSQNQQNQALTGRKAKSGLLGAHHNKKAGKWQSTICANRKWIYLGLFDTAQAAHEAYCKAKAELHPTSPANWSI